MIECCLITFTLSSTQVNIYPEPIDHNRFGVYKFIFTISKINYPWISHHGYVSNDPKWEWLHKRFLLSMFSRQSGKAKKFYIDFVQDKNSLELTDFFSRKNIASIFGSSDYVEWVKGKFYDQKHHDEVPESRQLAPTISDIKKAVCLLYKENEKVLEQTKRGQVNEPRNLTIYLARKHRGLKLSEIGVDFGLEKYSSVSSIVMRTEHLISQKKYNRYFVRVKQRLDNHLKGNLLRSLKVTPYRVEIGSIL